jgi:hypothetical protein
MRNRLTTFLMALALGAPVCRAQPATTRHRQGGRAVTPSARTQIHSIVLESTHILLVEVLDAQPGPWQPAQPGLKSRQIAVQLRVAEVLRGRLDSQRGAPLQTTITQYDYAGELMMQSLPGCWSGQDLRPGSRFAVLAQTNESRAERILLEPACKQVLPAEPVLPELRIAAQAESDNLPLDRTLALARAEITRLDALFADFLWAKYGDEAMESQASFNQITGFLERRGLQVQTRQMLLKDGYDLVGLYGDETPERAQRLAKSMFRTLLMPDTAPLHANLIGTYLPNLLGISSSLPPQSPDTVFKDHEAERDAVTTLLEKLRNDGGARQLLSWLKRQ